jgi:hypothetical protein
MKYGVDASIVVRLELSGPAAPQALRLREDYQKKIHELIAPESILWETANALIKAERQRVSEPGGEKTLFQGARAQ